ncbi:hypothetical protein [Streptomyces sp. NPDC051546]
MNTTPAFTDRIRTLAGELAEAFLATSLKLAPHDVLHPDCSPACPLRRC